MNENEFLLQDRITKIKSVMEQYGEENFYISFSGGKDSTVLSYLIDLALPNNEIPRVYADTGIELNMIRDYVYSLQENDKRINVIKPTIPIKPTLERDGYPFKSKKHASMVKLYQKFGTTDGHAGLEHYLHISNDGVNWGAENSCPKCLKYQFTPEFNIKISDLCCKRMKEEPLENWSKQNKKRYAITGIMRAEGGRRANAQCLSIHGGKLKAFQPLAVLDKDWENWFIKEYNVVLCDIYKHPYNFKRTGCKGCPFAVDLKRELIMLRRFFPNEYKQCELIWEPVYNEYRRIGYRI